MTTPSASTISTAPRGSYDLLYRIAAIAALTTVAVTVAQIVLGVLWPPPDFSPTAAAASDILAMAAANPVLTFLRLDGLMVFDYLLLIVVFLALYAALEKHDPSLMRLGTALALIAITLYLSVYPAATLLVLAFRLSAPGADPAGIVPAAQALLAAFQGTAFLVHYIVMGIAGMLVGLVVLRRRPGLAVMEDLSGGLRYGEVHAVGICAPAGRAWAAAARRGPRAGAHPPREPADRPTSGGGGRRPVLRRLRALAPERQHLRLVGATAREHQRRQRGAAARGVVGGRGQRQLAPG